MEIAHVKMSTQLGLSPRAKLTDFELPHLVRQGLAGSADIPVDLVGDIEQRQRGILGHIVNGLLAGPA